ncbi:MAG: lysophospholipid acyltransferase family protein, partial [Gemmatimonadota bacterium]|nr:lysophospholipid acyltransferase family protein [Gemmatimonadota bacterium]
MTFYRFCWWLAYGLAVVLFRLRVEGRRHIPQSGALILASNHCSNVDPVIIGVAAGRELWYLAKAELFPIPLLGKLIHKLHAMPVDRSRGDRSAFLAWTKILQDGNPVLIFPEGTRNKHPEFLRPRPGVGMLVYRTQAPVIPVYISGTVNIWKTMVGLDRLQVRFGK